MEKTYETVCDLNTLNSAIARVRAAQAQFATYSQQQVDAIFLAAATAANQARIPLALAAAEETGMGVAEDKVIKNHYAAEYIITHIKIPRPAVSLRRTQPSAFRRLPSLSA